MIKDGLIKLLQSLDIEYLPEDDTDDEEDAEQSEMIPLKLYSDSDDDSTINSSCSTNDQSHSETDKLDFLKPFFAKQTEYVEQAMKINEKMVKLMEKNVKLQQRNVELEHGFFSRCSKFVFAINFFITDNW